MQELELGPGRTLALELRGEALDLEVPAVALGFMVTAQKLKGDTTDWFSIQDLAAFIESVREATGASLASVGQGEVALAFDDTGLALAVDARAAPDGSQATMLVKLPFADASDRLLLADALERELGDRLYL